MILPGCIMEREKDLCYCYPARCVDLLKLEPASVSREVRSDMEFLGEIYNWPGYYFFPPPFAWACFQLLH